MYITKSPFSLLPGSTHVSDFRMCACVVCLCLLDICISILCKYPYYICVHIFCIHVHIMFVSCVHIKRIAVCWYICMHAYIHVSMHIYMCGYTCMCICSYKLIFYVSKVKCYRCKFLYLIFVPPYAYMDICMYKCIRERQYFLHK